MSSPAKILFVSHEATRTGAPMFLLHLVRWLRAQGGWDFEILIAKSGPLDDDFAQTAPVRTPEYFSKHPDLMAAFTLIYSNTVCNGSTINALPRGSIPVVTHVHELDYGYDSLGAKNMALVIAHSAHFIACADAVADRLGSVFRIPTERISVHHELIDVTAVETNVARGDLAALRARFDLPADAAILAGCGTFDMRKAPDLFLQLAARIRDRWTSPRPLRFVWIGRMNVPELGKIVRHDSRRLGLEKELKLIGELSEPHALLSLADLFCLTSREDPFPLAMLEAGAMGKPVVCFDRAGGGPEYCAAGGGIAVPFLNIEAMADACLHWLNQPDTLARDGARAATTVRERFSVQIGMPALGTTLQSLLGQAATLSPLFAADSDLADIYANWDDVQAPQAEAVAAYVERSARLKQAEQLARQGRRADAIKLMLQAVNVDIARKDAHILLESLREVSQRLAPIEPRQAAYLREKAEAMLRPPLRKAA